MKQSKNAARGVSPCGPAEPSAESGSRAGLAGRQEPTGKVLVLGHDTRSFLAVVRSLGRRGLDVHVAWCPTGAPAAQSRYIRKHHELPHYEPDTGRGIPELLAVLEAERFDLIVPCNDASILPLRRHRQEIERVAPLCLPDEDACEIMFDKIRTGELAESLGIRLPRQAVIADARDLQEVQQALTPPLVLKPRSSFALDRLESKATVKAVSSWAEAVERLPSLLGMGPVLVQEVFRGSGAGVEVLADRGDILVAFQHMRVHEPPRGGGSSYRRSTAVWPELLAASRLLLEAVEYTGVAMIEFRVDPRTHDWIFVEVNSRFWGSLPLAVAAGADFPAFAYDLFVCGRRSFPATFRTGIYSRNAALDLGWHWAAIRSRQPLAALKAVSGSVARGVLNTITLRERSDTLVLDDVGPAIAEITRVGARYGEKLRGRIRPALLRLPALRRHRRRQMLKQVEQARSILFVCKGNICRSAFAEHYAREALNRGVQIASCGSYPVSGREPPEVATQVAGEMGIQMASHRSQVLTPELVNGADVIFTFDRINRAEVLRRVPESRGKVFDLGLAGVTPDVLIPDPYGTGAETFRGTYRRIAQAIDDIVAHTARPRAAEHARQV